MIQYFFIPKNILNPILYEKLPHEEDVEDIAKKIRANRNNLDSYTIDDLILLISTAAEKWLRRSKSNIVKTAKSSFSV